MEKLKVWIKAILPHPFHFYFQKKRRAASRRAVRRDVVQFELAKNAYLEVYWKIFGVGQGPAIALYVEDEEVLKFDCYGKTGHYHMQMLEPTAPKRPMLWMLEETVEAQVERALFELERNLHWYLERHPLKAVRQTKINRTRLKTVLPEARACLLAYQDRIPVAKVDAANHA